MKPQGFEQYQGLGLAELVRRREASPPIGVHFGARLGDEATLFRLAAQLEQARPWAARRRS